MRIIPSKLDNESMK